MRVPVDGCEVTGCAYCLHKHCQAANIEVTGAKGECASFTRSVMFNVNPRFASKVTICRSSDCTSNRNAGCLQPSVLIGSKGSKAVCLNFKRRAPKPANQVKKAGR